MRAFALALSALLSALPAFGQPATAPAAKPHVARSRVLPAPEKVAQVEGITEYRLANGLRVLLFPDASKPSMTVNITYLVGSRQENYGETGMAHLLEHLLFKGTPTHPDPTKTLTALGGRANGSTWFDRTNYFVSFPASEANLATALELEADRMVNSFIARKDLDSEMTVVRNEFEAGENDPENVTTQRLQSVAFDWHNYGKDTIGAKSDIEHVDIPRLQAFYRQYYQPDNAVLLVAGRIDEAKTLALVNQLFGSIPKPKRALTKTYTEEPTQDGERSVTVRRVGGTPLVAAGYHIPASSDPEWPALGLAARILANTPSGRLHRALVDTKLASAVFEQRVSTLDPSFVIFGATLPADSKPDAALEVLLNTVEHASTPPSPKSSWTGRRPRLLKQIDLIIQRDLATRHRAQRGHGRGRLAPLLPQPRPAGEGDLGRSPSRGRALLQSQQPDGGHLRADGEAGPLHECRPPATLRRWCATTRAERRWLRAKSSTPRRPTSKPGRRASRRPTDSRVRCFPRRRRGRWSRSS